MTLIHKYLFLLGCFSVFNLYASTKDDLFKYKNDIRNLILSNTSIKLYEEGSIASVRRLVDSPKLLTKITEIEEKNLLTARLKTHPWSDDYWAIARGILGARYADDEFAIGSDWKEFYNYVIDRQANKIFDTQDPKSIDLLSPSEKYDLLIGKNYVSLTDAMWSQGKAYYDRYGSVESWMGICHGWAPASYMLPRPKNAIEVTSFNGETKIKFYPSDIKALASLLWATTNPPVKFIGSRCQEKEPAEDSDGRISSRKCRDVNPAVWHLSVVNQVGDLKKSMVIDNTYSYEVWNQPLIGYEYFYFNPKTNERVDTLSEAMVNIEDFPEDKYRNYRPSGTRKIVGIYLNVEYGVETYPIQRPTDSDRYDRSMKSVFKYDLEIDSDNNIIGGEWHSKEHPDFLWTPMSDTKALTDFDFYLLGVDKWNGENKLEANVQNLAQNAAANGRPLAYIVESLIKISNEKQSGDSQ